MSLYRAAAQRGITQAELDACSIPAVRWMLAEPEDPDAPESHDDYVAHVLEAAEARAHGGTPTADYEPLDPSQLPGLMMG